MERALWGHRTGHGEGPPRATLQALKAGRQESSQGGLWPLRRMGVPCSIGLEQVDFLFFQVKTGSPICL
jgi:hypothetical protein